MSRSVDTLLAVEAPFLLVPRRKFNPSKLSASDRRELAREIEFANVNLARLRAESRIASQKLGPPG